MGNLFLKEKERWGVWTLLGILGAAITTVVAAYTHDPVFISATAMVLVVLVSSWMQYTKRFFFLRALKVSLYVMTLSVLPALFSVIAPASHQQKPELIAQSIFLALLSVIGCIICAYIAKCPKQYY